MQKVLYSLLVIGIVSSIVVGSGAIAVFSDTETSTGNTFTAGTVNLTPNNPRAFVTGLTNLEPNVGNPGQYITMTNSGSIDAAQMDLDIIIAGEADKYLRSPDGTGEDMSDTEFAETLKIEELTWKGNDLTASITDTNGNGYKDLAEAAAANLNNQAGLDVGESGTLRLDVNLDPDNEYGNKPQGDGVVIEVEFDLSQVED